MAAANYIQSSFLGGEWSQFIQGRIDRPDYRTAMNVCLNGFPVEPGAWVRRPGFQFAQTTRGGNAGRLISFAFQQAAPYTIEFTSGFLRFRNGPNLVTTNDAQAVVSVSTANPAVVTTMNNHGWSSGNQGMFNSLGTNNPLLQNRVFAITVTGVKTFTVSDAVTGTNIDGSTLGTFVSGNFVRIYEFSAPYVGTLWSNVRLVQTDTQGVLLHASIAPYVLAVTAAPTSSAPATFTLATITFKDGPYLDPVGGGTLATPSGTTGILNITLSFAQYAATTAYQIGDHVTSVSINYKSLTDGNLGNTPATSPANWQAVASTDVIGPNGFVAGDIGRLVRLLDAANHWTYGKITAILTEISRTLAGSVNIGDMTSGGGLAAAFDGITSQGISACAQKNFAGGGGAGGVETGTQYVGKNYTGASTQKIASGTLFPSSDQGLGGGSIYVNNASHSLFGAATISFTVNLRAKATAPANSADGTLLGTTGQIANTTAPIVITSSDATTAWGFVWFEISATVTNDPQSVGGVSTDVECTYAAAEVKFFNPPGSGVGSGFSLQLIGPNLASTATISVWRLGVYSNNTGWPTCGTYHEGRLWLSGAVPNRIDASNSNDLFNFAPTDVNGIVASSNAISYIFNAPDANPIFWMVPDLQGIIAGTLAGEWLIQPGAAGAMSPSNIAARRVTRIGCANIEPRRTEHTTVFVQRYGRKVMEYFADVYSGKFTAPHLSHTGKHLTKGGILELAYQQELAPIVWSRINSGGGSLVGCVYKRDTLTTSQGPTIAGWHRHMLGSARVVESVCVGPSVGGTLDTLAIVSNDTSSNVRHVELMTDILDEGSLQSAAAYLDDAVTPTSTTTTNTASNGYPYGGLTLNGLWHLNGKTVTAWLGGLDCGDYAVSNGSFTVPYGDGVSGGTGQGLFTAAFVTSGIAANGVTMFTGTMPMAVGFTFTSDGQIVRPALPAESGARAGPAIGKKRRSHYIVAQLDSTQGVSFGTTLSTGTIDAANFRKADDTVYRVNEQFSGIFRDQLTDDYSFDGMVCWRVTRPYICNIAAIGSMIHTQDV